MFKRVGLACLHFVTFGVRRLVEYWSCFTLVLDDCFRTSACWGGEYDLVLPVNASVGQDARRTCVGLSYFSGG